MDVVNPATGKVVDNVAETDVQQLPALLKAAKVAQRSWAALAPSARKAVLARFRQLVSEQKEELAQTLTREVGKPLGQARNELNGLLPRIDFFLEHFEAELQPRTVLGTGTEALEERIVFEPLGVVANVSAWN